MSRVITDVVALDDDDVLSGGLVAGVELTVRDGGRVEVWLVGLDGGGRGIAVPWTDPDERPRPSRSYDGSAPGLAMAEAIEDVFAYGLCAECDGAGRYEEPRVPGSRDPADVVEVDCGACDGTGRAS